MYREEVTQFSRHLEREMHILIHGDAGMPVLCFPTQDSMCRNYEEFGMVEQLEDFITDGRIQLFVVDTVDKESWSDSDGDPEQRIMIQEKYFHYITEEAMSLIRKRNPEAPAVTGFSMGANHAAITFLRRPDLFRGVIALSGLYDSRVFFGDFMNSTLYDNSPECFLPNMPDDHPYIRLYNNRKLIFCCGQGAWEEEGIRSLKNLETIFESKGIYAWCDFWGYDVNHDWPWWYRQMRYFLPFMIEEKAGEIELAKNIEEAQEADTEGGEKHV